ncbi:hypothetical protein D3C84_1223640 [compost metagenome]
MVEPGVAQVLDHVPVVLGEGEAVRGGDRLRDLLVPVVLVREVAVLVGLEGLAVHFVRHGAVS